MVYPMTGTMLFTQLYKNNTSSLEWVFFVNQCQVAIATWKYNLSQREPWNWESGLVAWTRTSLPEYIITVLDAYPNQFSEIC